MALWRELYGNKWRENIVLASTPLWKYDLNNVPIANASGCLVDMLAADLFFLSHASIAQYEWTLPDHLILLSSKRWTHP